MLSLSLLNSAKKSLVSEGFSFGALTRNDYIIIFLLRHVIIKRLILWGDNAVQHFASVLCHITPYMYALLALLCIL